MGAQPPEGKPAPPDGSLPGSVLGVRPFGVYVHVPFCASRCGYCDFNTYTAAELGTDASAPAYVEAALAELRLARRVLGPADRPVSTVFFGGGTPTLLEPTDLARLLAEVAGLFGLESGAEVTCEANPDSIGRPGLERLRIAGFTRISFGMQSTSARALSVLERSHTPGRAVEAVGDALAAGFGHVSADLIYGIPGEVPEEVVDSVEAALAAGVDHVSAYALIVEEGTRLAMNVRRGSVVMPDDDEVADAYLELDSRLRAAGLHWYELSNWARPGGECRHNIGYWRGHDWWGVGPGAHSHVGGVRWWNVRHPAAYAQRLASGLSPAQAREVLTAEERREEEVLLRLRLAEGLPLELLHPEGRHAAARAAEAGLLVPDALTAGRAVLTLEGRLLADAVVRDLVD